MSWRKRLLSEEYLFHKENGERLLASGCLGEARLELEKSLDILLRLKNSEAEELEAQLTAISKTLIEQNMQKAAYFQQEGELAIALDFLQNSLGLARDSGTKDEVLMEISNLKMVMNSDGLHDTMVVAEDASEVEHIFAQAMEFALSGLYERAVFELKKALLIEPENDEVYLRLANACSDSGRYIEAVEYYELGLRLHGKNQGRIYFRLGKLYALSAEHNRAEEHLLKALHLEPENVDVLLALGSLYARLNQLEKSIDCYEKLISLDEDDMDIRLKLAELLEKSGHFKQALELWREVIKRSESDIFREIATDKLHLYD